MRTLRDVGRCTVAAALGAGLLAAAPAAADEVADFYKDKTLTIWSGLSPGGSYTAYALALKDHMKKFLPGNPTIIVGSRTGGSGRVLANWMYNVGPRDGSMFGLIHERMGLEPHVYPKGTKFDGRKMSWIGSMAKQKSVCFTWHESKVKTFEDAQKMTAIVGTSSSTATGSVMPRMLNSMAGTKFRWRTRWALRLWVGQPENGEARFYPRQEGQSAAAVLGQEPCRARWQGAGDDGLHH